MCVWGVHGSGVCMVGEAICRIKKTVCMMENLGACVAGDHAWWGGMCGSYYETSDTHEWVRPYGLDWNALLIGKTLLIPP